MAEFGYAAVAVYSLLYQSAYKDQRYDRTRCSKRRDCGGTTIWPHKGIANKLHTGRQKVIECIDLLLDNGFIQQEGFIPSAKGSKHRIYRVVHPTVLAIVKDVMPILPCLPSVNAKKRSTYQQRPSYHQGEDLLGQSETEDINSWEQDGRLNDTSL